MRYSQLEAGVLQLIVGAIEDSVHAFGAETVTRLVRPELLRGAAEDELPEEVRTALTPACANVLPISAADLRDELATTYDGILIDDDLDTGVLTPISASAHCKSFLERNRRGERYQLAIRSIEDVDHEVSAAYNRIRRRLGPGTKQGLRTHCARSRNPARDLPHPLHAACDTTTHTLAATMRATGGMPVTAQSPTRTSPLS